MGSSKSELFLCSKCKKWTTIINVDNLSLLAFKQLINPESHTDFGINQVTMLNTGSNGRVFG